MISDSFLKLALQVAESSPSRRKIGAVLLRKNRIISTATNLEQKSHPLQARLATKVGLPEKIYLHAEIHALIRAKEDADTIIVARINNQGKLRNSKPCPICELALNSQNINQIYYTTNKGFMYFSPELFK